MSDVITAYKRRLVLFHRRHEGVAEPTTSAAADVAISAMRESVREIRALEREVAAAGAALSPAQGMRGFVSSLLGQQPHPPADPDVAARLEAYAEIVDTAVVIRRQIEMHTLPHLRRQREALSLAEAQQRLAVDYHRYIRSKEWREKAEAAKDRAGQRCQVCNRARDEVQLDAHHRTYERLGHEDPADITVLCRDCHQSFEENKERITGSRACKRCGERFEPLYASHQYCRTCYRAATAGGNGSTSATGHCIRCGTSIPLDPQAPYCRSCYRTWARYKNLAYAEAHCHICGGEADASMAKPACYRCYRRERGRLAFAEQ